MQIFHFMTKTNFQVCIFCMGHLAKTGKKCVRGKNKMKYFLAGEKMNLVQKYTPANFPILPIQQGYINKTKKLILFAIVVL